MTEHACHSKFLLSNFTLASTIKYNIHANVVYTYVINPNCCHNVVPNTRNEVDTYTCKHVSNEITLSCSLRQKKFRKESTNRKGPFVRAFTICESRFTYIYKRIYTVASGVFRIREIRRKTYCTHRK